VAQSQYFIRDLGSAGGTFIRIPHGKRFQLHPGMIILLGKHQFTISSIDDGIPMGSSSSSGKGGGGGSSRKNLLSLVENAEKIISDFSRHENGSADANGLSTRLKNLTMEISSHLHQEVHDVSIADAKHGMVLAHDADAAHDSDDSAGAGAADAKMDAKSPGHAHGHGNGGHHKESAGDNMSSTMDVDEPSGGTTAGPSGAGAGHMKLMTMRTLPIGSDEFDRVTGSNNNSGKHGLGSHNEEDDDDEDMRAADAKGCVGEPSTPYGDNKAGGGGNFFNNNNAKKHINRRCVLTCCAPDGSPLQGWLFMFL
jgi:hypothetical protein